jgi:hypothetical protein
MGGGTAQNLVPDLNTGMMVDDGTGQFVGGPGEIGTTAANFITTVQAWFWPGVAIVAALLILRR